MDLNEIRKLADLMSEMALTEIELEEGGKRIRLRKEVLFGAKEERRGAGRCAPNRKRDGDRHRDEGGGRGALCDRPFPDRRDLL
ncbi:MAG: hypothetical protein MPW15_20380 [Candidatus Manganitrophus sp.]|nr:hypothetical protein [Candidatus Manganitrophus sp.]